MSIVGTRLLTYGIRISSKVRYFCNKFEYKDCMTLSVVVSNLLSCIRKDNVLVYSRNKSLPTMGSRKITARKVIRAVDFLEKEGLVVNHIGVGHASIYERKISFLEPTGKFMDLWREDLVEKVLAEKSYLEAVEVVEVRGLEDIAKKGVYTQTDFNTLAEVVRSLNKLNDSFDIKDKHGKQLNNMYCRVFNGGLDLGGRFYKADVLSIRNKEEDAGSRLGITIDGESVVEVDYSNLHFRIASAMESLSPSLVPTDVYEGVVDGECSAVDRSIVKVSVNIMFNSSSVEQARKAIQGVINSKSSEEKAEYTLGTAKSVIALIRMAYPHHAHLLCADDNFGLILQNQDATLAESVAKVFIEKGKPILIVHDSFLVRSYDMDLLLQSMGDCFRSQFFVDYGVPVKVEYLENGEVLDYRLVV